MQVKKSYWMPAVVGLIAVISGGWLLQQGQNGNVYLQSRLLQDVIRVVSDRYVDEVEPAELYDLAVDGLLEKLGDPHTTLLRPEDYADLRLSTTGNYGGLGIRIDEKDGWIYAAPVGSFPAGRSPFGCDDMAGNAAEWVNDWYDSIYYTKSGTTNPKGPQTSTGSRGVRGGSWADNDYEARAANRTGLDPNFGTDAVGFRCASRG